METDQQNNNEAPNSVSDTPPKEEGTGCIPTTAEDKNRTSESHPVYWKDLLKEYESSTPPQQSFSSETCHTPVAQCEKRRRLRDDQRCTALQIDALHEQLLKLQSHALHLESELSKARIEVDRLRAGAAAAAAAHAQGRCSCQRIGGLNGALIYCSHCQGIMDGCPKCIFGPTVQGYQTMSKNEENTPKQSNMLQYDSEQYTENRRKAKGKPNNGSQSRYWSPEEHRLFLEALAEFGHKDLRAISTYVGTRSMVQCRTHLQKYFMKLAREAKRNTSKQQTTGWSSLSISPLTQESNNTSPSAYPSEEADRNEKTVPDLCGVHLLSVVANETHGSFEEKPESERG
eukprot:jgi/Galph1/5244/GphlegSOOS_G3825.1